MVERNPFDLSRRRRNIEAPERNYPSRDWTPEEQVAKLKGYLEVAPEYWEQIRRDSHVRYITKAGEFRVGGFVMRNPVDSKFDGAEEVKRSMQMQNMPFVKAKNYAMWHVSYAELARVFVKMDAIDRTLIASQQEVVQALNENIRKLAEYAKRLEARLAALEDRAGR